MTIKIAHQFSLEKLCSKKQKLKSNFSTSGRKETKKNLYDKIITKNEESIRKWSGK